MDNELKRKELSEEEIESVSGGGDSFEEQYERCKKMKCAICHKIIGNAEFVLVEDCGGVMHKKCLYK